MKCKCRICGKALTTDVAYLVMSEKKKAYYCSQEEYKTDKANKKKAAEDKDKVYYLICEILGRKTKHTSLWKEKAEWNEIATDEVIGKYLEENKNYLVSVISNLENKEFTRIRYLSAIIKNSIGDFKINEKVEKPKVQVDETFYAPSITRNNKRRSLEDLEDDY